MPDEPFMLVSLEEAKAKKLAQVLNNETSTKILNLLTKGKKTESELAKELNLPASTIHYNMKQLVEAKLVVAKEFHYSSKGREVMHYELANKYIIIAPQEGKDSFLEKLKGFLPVTVFVVAVAAILRLLSPKGAEPAPMMEIGLRSYAADSMMMEEAMAVPVQKASWVVTTDFIYGFLVGAVVVILFMILYQYLRARRK